MIPDHAITDEGSGPALLLVHGWGQSRHGFAPLVALLRDRFRCVAVDLPGHGDARELPGPFSYSRYAGELAAVVERLGLAPFHMLGWSMGGSIATGYLLDAAGPAPASLTLLSSTPRFLSPEKNGLVGQHPARMAKMIRMMKSDPEGGLRGFIAMLFAVGEAQVEARRAELEGYLMPPGAFPPATDALIATLEELAETDLTGTAAGYGGPVGLVYGSRDGVAPRGGQKLWEPVYPGAVHYELAGAGHAPLLTRTADVADAVVRIAGGNRP